MLEAASMIDEERVSQLFASSISSQTGPAPTAGPSQISLQSRGPSISLYDGKPGNLRSFCSQLVNQIQGDPLASEEAKVRFAYQCLGPGALAKMRSSFHHLEDPKAPAEIKSLSDFLAALKQRCQDPGLEERASRTIDSLTMGTSSFHQFITVFEDNMADSTYADQEKSQWRIMLRRRLSPKLKDALVMATDIPQDYHEFVAYLRQKDAGFHEARSTNIPLSSTYAPPSSPRILPVTPSFREYKEPTVSQGGTAMDLDAISQQKGEDGRLTQEAKDARKILGRCVWCNRSGHFAINCPLGTRGRTLAPTKQEAQLKDQLQH